MGATQTQKHLKLLAKQYPNVQRVCSEIINLQAILNLPKGTEHFMSDLHGEYQAFTHILNNASGVIREKIDKLFTETLSTTERAELCTLIYYPEEKLRQVKEKGAYMPTWYSTTLHYLVEVCREMAGKYTRSKVRKALPQEFGYIIDELLHADNSHGSMADYYKNITHSIIMLGNADAFIKALAQLIKRLAVDHLHIVGDIFDRGTRPDKIMDLLLHHHQVDFQWGNHDILWMGAAAGSPDCVAVTILNCVSYGNLEVLEQGYGINLRPLALFAQEMYQVSPRFIVKAAGDDSMVTNKDMDLAAKMYKAIAMIHFKLEGQLIGRHPEYRMEERRLLHKIDYELRMVEIDGERYPLRDNVFPTVRRDDPYTLTEQESRVMNSLCDAFTKSEKLARHIQFLYSNGSMYKCYNNNLLFHGCIPMNEEGHIAKCKWDGQVLHGRTLMDYWDALARDAYFGSGEAQDNARDGMYYLWCGRQSPLFGRDKMTTFERLFVEDKRTHVETEDPYYHFSLTEAGCTTILDNFELYGETAHIINGHVPVKASKGESPLKAGGRLIVIDGGFCKAYHPKTGIAGYTLIFNSYGMRLSAHRPFESVQKAIEKNEDIHSVTDAFETRDHRLKVEDTDIGSDLREQISDLTLLLAAYQGGKLQEQG